MKTKVLNKSVEVSTLETGLFNNLLTNLECDECSDYAIGFVGCYTDNRGCQYSLNVWGQEKDSYAFITEEYCAEMNGEITALILTKDQREKLQSIIDQKRIDYIEEKEESTREEGSTSLYDFFGLNPLLFLS